MEPPPRHIDLKKDRGLTIEWADGSSSYFTIPYLRKMSPSADARELRDEQRKNPLAILPSSFTGDRGPMVATGAELVGNYAIKIIFSDGHATGIYSWDYLREIDPVLADGKASGGPGRGGAKGDGDDGSAFHRTPIR